MTPEIEAWLQRIEEKLDALLNLLTTGEAPPPPVIYEIALTPASDSPEPKKRPKRVTEITGEFRTEMVLEFGEILSGVTVHAEIDLAVAHKSHAKYDGKQQHVRNWLKKAVEHHEAHAPPTPKSAEEKRTRYLDDYRRRSAEDDHGR